MQWRTLLSIVLLFTLVISSATLYAAQDKPKSTEKNAETKVEISFPYVAQVSAENVYVRSGPGINYYRCSKLSAPTRVKVISHKFSWSMIVGPEDGFSWISKRFIKVDMSNPDFGVVTGDAVRVYAGSQYRGPIHSDRSQLKLNTGDKVRLLGEEKDDYYKIAPPNGAYFWIKTQYLKLLPGVKDIAAAKVEPIPVKVPVVVVPAEQNKQPDQVKTHEPSTDTDVAVVPAMTSVEAQKLQKFYELEKLIIEERAKPMNQQDYNDIKTQILKLAGADQQGKAAKYSQFEAKRIERFELALKAAKLIQKQDNKLKQKLDQIDRQKEVRYAEITAFGNFAVIGILQKSEVFTHKVNVPTYRIVTGSGRTVCYAVGQGSIALQDFTSMIGRKVGLAGSIEPHPETGSALVRFDDIKLLK